MQEEVKKIYEEIHSLESAVSRLEARKEQALANISQLQVKLPNLLMQFALGECPESEITGAHKQILQLQQVASEPIKEAIRPLSLKIKELQGSRILSQYKAEQKAKAEHQRYVDLFNKALTAKELTAQAGTLLVNIAPVELRNEAKELVRQFQAYRSAKADKSDARFEDYVTATPTLYAKE